MADKGAERVGKPVLASLVVMRSHFSYFLTVLEQKSSLVVVCLIAILFIAGFIYSVILGDTLRYHPDEWDYRDLVRNLITTRSYSLDGDTLTAYRPPGYPLFLAAFAFLGADVVHFRLLNFLILGLSMWVIYRLLKAQVSPLAALLASLLVISYPLFFYTAGALYPQTFASLLFLFTLYFLTRQEPATLDFCLSGLFFGYLVLTVPTFFFVLFVLAGWYLFYRRNRFFNGFILTIAIAALLIGAWTARNYAVFSTFVFVSTNSGENLLLGNCENTTPNAGRTADITKYMVAAASLGEIERDQYYRSQAVSFILNNKLHIAKLYVLKVFNYFNFKNELVTQAEASSLKNFVMLLSYLPLLVLFMIRLPMTKIHPLSPLEILLVFLYFSNAFYSAIFFTRIRFRLPFDFLLIIGVAILVEIVIRHWLPASPGRDHHVV